MSLNRQKNEFLNIFYDLYSSIIFSWSIIFECGWHLPYREVHVINSIFLPFKNQDSVHTNQNRMLWHHHLNQVFDVSGRARNLSFYLLLINRHLRYLFLPIHSIQILLTLQIWLLVSLLALFITLQGLLCLELLSLIFLALHLLHCHPRANFLIQIILSSTFFYP